MTILTFDNPGTAPAPAGPYSNVARVDLGGATLLVLAGQIALDEHGTLVGEGDVAAQSHRIFATIGALLAAHGAAFGDVVHIRTFLTDLGLLRAYGQVRATYLTGPPPASTTVEVSGLFRPGALLEVEVMAALRP
ncbi:RidA family protein [Actinomadura scrupuli]|uniref:RidA family protein n=1 Tax=Actinomadura scrupuli TaxID=559629 RepID=UPI003D9917FD